jgi:hypothetical protein
VSSTSLHSRRIHQAVRPCAQTLSSNPFRDHYGYHESARPHRDDAGRTVTFTGVLNMDLASAAARNIVVNPGPGIRSRWRLSANSLPCRAIESEFRPARESYDRCECEPHCGTRATQPYRDQGMRERDWLSKRDRADAKHTGCG